MVGSLSCCEAAVRAYISMGTKVRQYAFNIVIVCPSLNDQLTIKYLGVDIPLKHQSQYYQPIHPTMQ